MPLNANHEGRDPDEVMAATFRALAMLLAFWDEFGDDGVRCLIEEWDTVAHDYGYDIRAFFPHINSSTSAHYAAADVGAIAYRDAIIRNAIQEPRSTLSSLSPPTFTNKNRNMQHWARGFRFGFFAAFAVLFVLLWVLLRLDGAGLMRLNFG